MGAHLYDQRWFTVTRIVVLSAIAMYSMLAIYSNTRLMLGQQSSDRQTFEAERAAEIRARVRALEEQAKEARADRIAERVSALENGMVATEKSVRQLTEDLSSLSRTANAILLGMVAFLIKEIIDLFKKRQS